MKLPVWDYRNFQIKTRKHHGRNAEQAAAIKAAFDIAVASAMAARAATTTASSPSTTTTTGSAVSRAPKRISGPERELRELVRRCFVSGDCGGGEDVKTTSPPPRPAPPSTTPSPRQREVHRRVLERARACLFNGEC